MSNAGISAFKGQYPVITPAYRSICEASGGIMLGGKLNEAVRVSRSKNPMSVFGIGTSSAQAVEEVEVAMHGGTPHPWYLQ